MDRLSSNIPQYFQVILQHIDFIIRKKLTLNSSSIENEKYRRNQSGLHFSNTSSCLIKIVDEYNANSLFHLFMDHDNESLSRLLKTMTCNIDFYQKR